MIRIAGLRALSDRLARLDMTGAQAAAMEGAARRLQEAVQHQISTPPGGDHATPWRRTGSLQTSIDHRSDDTGAVIGSDDSAAVAQELGTRNIPPRPFLSTTAAANAEAVARQVAVSVVAEIRAGMKGTTS